MNDDFDYTDIIGSISGATPEQAELLESGLEELAADDAGRYVFGVAGAYQEILNISPADLVVTPVGTNVSDIEQNRIFVTSDSIVNQTSTNTALFTATKDYADKFLERDMKDIDLDRRMLQQMTFKGDVTGIDTNKLADAQLQDELNTVKLNFAGVRAEGAEMADLGDKSAPNREVAIQKQTGGWADRLG